MKQQTSLLNWQSSQQSQEICQLREELGVAKQHVLESQHFAQELKSELSVLVWVYFCSKPLCDPLVQEISLLLKDVKNLLYKQMVPASIPAISI